LPAGFINDFTKRKGELLKVWKQSLILLDGERGEKPVLNRIMRPDRYRHE
jgi:hypothetical protein